MYHFKKLMAFLLCLAMLISMLASCQGDKGDQGVQGDKGDQGIQGVQGDKGDKGDKGDTGATIEKVEFDEQGRLVITLTDGTVLDPVVIPEKEEHVHTCGEWMAFGEDLPQTCEQKVFYRVCSDCSNVEWKMGSYADHKWSTATTAPTCQAGGYDTKTCTTCGKVETCNETEKVDHPFEETYTADNSFHWFQCVTCETTKDQGEHTPDGTGACSVCDALVGPTEGVVYNLSADGTYADVIGYTGSAKRVRIADQYEGVPVKTIYDSAFKENEIIIEILIPDSVTSIGEYAFSSCTSLVSVTMGDSVTSIGNGAFGGCRSLASVTIPDSVTSIGIAAFLLCSKLQTTYKNCIYVGSTTNPYQILIHTANNDLSTYTIHSDTKVIMNSAFHGCSRLSSITIPDSVTSIGSYAFFGCESLASVTIPDSVTSIGDSAFSSCTSLASVTISDSVTSIGKFAFNDCTSLVSIRYCGSNSQWQTIAKGIGWAWDTGSYTVTYNYTDE